VTASVRRPSPKGGLGAKPARPLLHPPLKLHRNENVRVYSLISFPCGVNPGSATGSKATGRHTGAAAMPTSARRSVPNAIFRNDCIVHRRSINHHDTRSLRHSIRPGR